MKKRVIAAAIIAVLFCTAIIYPDTAYRLLRIEKSPGWEKGKRELNMLLEDLQHIIDIPGLETSNEEIHIRVFNPQGKKILKLGVIKKGKVKWYFKKASKKYLRVKPDKAEADRLWQEVASKKRKRCYRMANRKRKGHR